jgi:hypothetical protein
MTPRPLISSSSRRPLSAIFLGSLPPKDPKEFNIPDLPEPPESPGAVSTASGLPSPPATNSTGSGSAGDNNSASSGSTRQRPVSYSSSSNLIMSTENNGRPTSLSKTSRPSSDEDDENDHANEEDNTARLDLRLAGQGPSENVAALQRVKSLAQRNRMVSLLRLLFSLYSSATRHFPPHVLLHISDDPRQHAFLGTLLTHAFAIFL